MQGRGRRFFVLVLLGCCSVPVEAELLQTNVPGQSNGAPLFEGAIQEIVSAHCVKCHGPDKQKAQLNLSSSLGILKGGESGRVVTPGSPDESLLYELVVQREMPPDGEDPLSADEIDAIQHWIAGGALFSENQSEASQPLALGPTQHDILPILRLRCTACHGLRKQEADLDLRSRAAILRGGESGPAMIPGKPESSLIYQRIVAEEMPPRDKLIGARVKVMASDEIEQLGHWIELGAPEVFIEPNVAGKGYDPSVTATDREFWAFRPPRQVAPPSVPQNEDVQNPIDAFVLRKLKAKGLSFSPQAKPETLLRRAYLDLTGLPPEPDEVQAYLSDNDPLAYERAIDRLLASQRYGERWGRYWLDLAGYADSEGAREQDVLRPNAYRYRDYVIRSFNDNKPYDRFLLEQIAGDELANYEQSDVITEQIYDNLVATGFLRMAPDPTVASVTGLVPNRLDVIADEIDILGSGVMGLSVGCARCHSHKFDPIPQRDYYRLLATFKGAFDEHDWLEPNAQGKAPSAFRYLTAVTTKERRHWEAQEARLSSEIESLIKTREAIAATRKKKYFDQQLDRVPTHLRDDVRQAFQADPEQRSPSQESLVKKFEKTLQIGDAKLRELDEGYKKWAEDSDKQVKSLERNRRPEPAIRALWDRGEPSSTYLLRRGNYLTPGQLVGPGVISVLNRANEPFEVQPPWPGAKKTGRRLAFAKWLTEPDHPLTARVFVNRIWKHHFEHGIVKTLGNFGHSGALPTHPKLLDWLAVEFVRSGWNTKAMHRLIMTSNTYRQSSRITSQIEQIDPNNDALSRFPLKRLDAEALRDSILFIARRLDETPFGPPGAVEVRKDGLVTSVPTEGGFRRSAYIQQRRKHIPTIFEAFDFPQMNPNCLERSDSTVVTQALYLSNNQMVRKLAGSLADRVIRETGDNPADQIKRLYLIALSRMPNEEETQILAKTMRQLAEQWSATKNESESKKPMPSSQALTSVCHTIINAAEFIYVD